jgi:hypothetical protein
MKIQRAKRVVLGVALGLWTFDAAAFAPTPATQLDEVQAISAELKRGIGQLRLPESPAPYWAGATLVRRTSATIDGSYGGVIEASDRQRGQAVVEVRVGELARDNTGLVGQSNMVGFSLPMVPNPHAVQFEMWRAMDQAFRSAVADYTAKNSILARLQESERVADHLPWPAPAQVEAQSSAAQSLLKQDCNPPQVQAAHHTEVIKALSERFSQHTQIDNGDVHFEWVHACTTRVDSDGRLRANVELRATLSVVADTHADDGMHLDHARAVHWQGEIPDAATVNRVGEALVSRVLHELGKIAQAPVLSEDYDGPVLLAGDAAAHFLASTVGVHASAEPSPLSDGGRIVDLDPLWQRTPGSAVMPNFLSLVDDPTRAGFGHYIYDALGHSAEKVTLVNRGRLVDLLVGGQAIRGDYHANGHQRAALNAYEGVAISNLELNSTRRGLSERELERELLRRANEDGYEHAFIIELFRDGNLSGSMPRQSAQTYDASNKLSLPLPVLVYRIDAPGKRTLVRGVLLAPMSIRAMRRIREVGQGSTTLPLRMRPGFSGGLAVDGSIDGLVLRTVDVEIKTPSLLLDGGFELNVERGEQEKPPVLHHPLRRP